MTFQIRIAGSGITFPAEKGERLLAAAARAGIEFPHACNCGFCGLCAATVVSGEFLVYPPGSAAGVPSKGPKVPACCAEAASDAEIAIKYTKVERSLRLKIGKIEHPAPDVILMDVAASNGSHIPYRAGQFIDFLLEGGERRSYSLASMAKEGEPIELHIRHVPGGLFTDKLFGVSGPALREGDELESSIPEGEFRFDGESGRDVVFLVTGTGFAPAKAMIEEMISGAVPHPSRVILYWGGRHTSDLYLDGLCRKWDAELPWFSYRPLVSRATAEENWKGRTGHAQDAFLAEHGSEAALFDAYVCGSPRLVMDAAAALEAAGVARGAIHSDPFTSKADR